MERSGEEERGITRRRGVKQREKRVKKEGQREGRNRKAQRVEEGKRECWHLLQ